MNLKALNDNIILEKMDDAQETKSGITLSMGDQPLKKGRVLDVGSSVGKNMSYDVKIGSYVLYRPEYSTEYRDPDMLYVLVSDKALVAKVKE